MKANNKGLWSCNWVTLFQLEDIELVVADHVQGVVRTNFLASWDEINDDHEMQDTFALSSMESLEGKVDFGGFRTSFV